MTRRGEAPALLWLRADVLQGLQRLPAAHSPRHAQGPGGPHDGCMVAHAGGAPLLPLHRQSAAAAHSRGVPRNRSYLPAASSVHVLQKESVYLASGGPPPHLIRKLQTSRHHVAAPRIVCPACVERTGACFLPQVLLFPLEIYCEKEPWNCSA